MATSTIRRCLRPSVAPAGGVILESFIWFEDEVGRRLHAVLLEAARRGIQVEVLLDGYGSPDLSDEFVGELTAAGVIFRYYDPRPKLMGDAHQSVPSHAP